MEPKTRNWQKKELKSKNGVRIGEISAWLTKKGRELIPETKESIPEGTFENDAGKKGYVKSIRNL